MSRQRRVQEEKHDRENLYIERTDHFGSAKASGYSSMAKIFERNKFAHKQKCSENNKLTKALAYRIDEGQRERGSKGMGSIWKGFMLKK